MCFLHKNEIYFQNSFQIGAVTSTEKFFKNDPPTTEQVNLLNEYIQKIFGEKLPLLTTNKWKIGHTFGASGILSIEMAILMLQHQEFIGVPFAPEQNLRKQIRKVLVNAVGFGGNAVSVLLSL